MLSKDLEALKAGQSKFDLRTELDKIGCLQYHDSLAAAGYAEEVRNAISLSF